MKAIVVTSFGGPEVMKYTDVDIPAISEDQVLIRVVATSANFADIKSRYGKKEIKHYLYSRDRCRWYCRTCRFSCEKYLSWTTCHCFPSKWVLR